MHTISNIYYCHITVGKDCVLECLLKKESAIWMNHHVSFLQLLELAFFPFVYC